MTDAAATRGRVPPRRSHTSQAKWRYSIGNESRGCSGEARAKPCRAAFASGRVARSRGGSPKQYAVPYTAYLALAGGRPSKNMASRNSSSTASHEAAPVGSR
eukprot:9470926-Pyramimonas_sp.AAC.1